MIGLLYLILQLLWTGCWYIRCERNPKEQPVIFQIKRGIFHVYFKNRTFDPKLYYDRCICQTSTIHVLKDIDFEVEKGEFVAIMGKSGCGKSTFLKLLA